MHLSSCLQPYEAGVMLNCSFDHPIVILVYYYAINQVISVLFLQHFWFFWGLLCKRFVSVIWIIRNLACLWYELSGTHLAINMSCREPILLVFREAAVPWIFPCFCCFCHGPMKLTLIKGSKHTLGSRFCCPCLELNETHFDQRQQTCLWKQVFAASVKDPMKLTLIKGSKHAFGSMFLLPPPRIQRNSLWSKAANMT